MQRKKRKDANLQADERREKEKFEEVVIAVFEFFEKEFMRERERGGRVRRCRTICYIREGRRERDQ